MKKAGRPVLNRTFIYLAIALSMGQLFSVSGFFSKTMNADDMYLPSLFNDIVSGAVTDGSWYLTPSPYLFPDFLIYALLEPLFGLHGGFIIFSFLMMFALAGCTYALLKFLKVEHISSLKISAFTVLFFTTAFNIRHPDAFGKWVLRPTMHSGALLIGFLLLPLGLHTLKNRKNQLKYFLFVFIGALTAFSDPILLSQTILPLASASVFSAFLFKTQRSNFLKLAGCCLFVFLGSKLFDALFRATLPFKFHQHGSVNTENFNWSFKLFKSHFPWLSDAGSILLTTSIFGLFALFTACGIFVGNSLQKRKQDSSNDRDIKIVFLCLFAFASMMGALLPALLFGYYNHTNAVRYMQSFYIIPPIAIALFCGIQGRKGYCMPSLFFGTYVVLFVAQSMHSKPVLKEAVSIFSPKQDTLCIKNLAKTRGWHHGISDYWFAKTVTEETNRVLTIAQVTSNLKIYHWISNLNSFTRTHPGDTHYTYDVVFVNNLNISSATSILGADHKVFKCGGFDIWELSKRQKRKLATHIKKQLTQYTSKEAI